jgi:hypothetical protein
MLPHDLPFLARRLYSNCYGSSFDVRTLIMNIGVGQPVGVRADSLVVQLHEGIHWRQLHGTTIGAFLMWLRHARECDVLHKLLELPKAARQALIAQRRAGRPLVAFDDRGLPMPPVDLTPPVDPLELLRCCFIDNLTIDTLFYTPAAVGVPHAPFEQILASAMADAATVLAAHHPAWAGFSYSAIQEAFTLRPESIVRVPCGTADQAASSRDELGTSDILEASAIANELFLRAATLEHRLRSAADDASPLAGPISIFVPDTPDPERFADEAAALLATRHGMAAREFFRLGHWSPDRPGSWLALMVACDLALNPPLPPLIVPRRRPQWPDLYPPLRFVRAAAASRAIGPYDGAADHAGLAAYAEKLAALTGLEPPGALLDRLELSPTHDFAAIVREEREQDLYDGSTSYYDFARWCQGHLMQSRSEDLSLAIAPGILAVRLLWHDHRALHKLLAGLAESPPVLTTHEQQLDHAAGSTVAFGTWLALSVLSWSQMDDLMLGTGDLHTQGFPEQLLEHADFVPRAAAWVVRGLGFNPWS